VNLISHLIERQLGLDPPLTRDLLLERDLPMPMPDGTVLLADRWAPRTGGDKLPVALMRSPYGRGALIAGGMVRPLAERGFQVILQSVRGTFGSGGAFEPMRNEREDGLATLEWVVKQPWFGDSIVLVGPSYLGYVQWAVADRLPPEVKAMIPQVTESALTLGFLRADAYSLETPFGWGGRRHRPPLPLYPGHSPPRRRRPVLGRDQPPGPGSGDDRPGQLGRRLVRHLPARPAPRLRRPARCGAGGAAHGRAVDAPVDGRGHDAGGPGVRARLRPRRRAAARTGAAVRDGGGNLAAVRVLAAARLLTPAVLPGSGRRAGRRASGRVGARRLPLRPGRPDPGRRRRAHGPRRRRWSPTSR